MDIWEACAAAAVPGPLQGRLLRLVESQEQVATGRLVSSLERQAVLENLLERSKPPLPAQARGLNYLLASPFRYPPLPHGSRFGTRLEPGIFYASRNLRPLLAEAAYYRFVFWDGMKDPPAGRLLTQHTLFRAAYRSERGLRLQAPPFAAFREVLRDPGHYAATQRLGTRLRSAGIEIVEYESARDPHCGINLALFTPRALRPARVLRQEEWLCETTEERVTLRPKRAPGVHPFPRALFLVDGRLPTPAA